MHKKISTYNQLHYNVIEATLDYGIKKHPLEQMNELGYKVIGAVPQSIGECWWFTVEEFLYPLPGYLKKMTYNFDYWHNNCHDNCEYFKKNPGCFLGGHKCLKEEKEHE